MAEETFGSKLKQMRKDLGSIVDRMNRDRSIDVATKAQVALVALADLEDEVSGQFDDTAWTWQPSEDEADG